MKNKIAAIVLFISIPTVLGLTSSESSISKPDRVNPIPRITPKPVVNYRELVKALIQVESGGIEDVHGDLKLKEGPSVGVLQIRPVMVREVNRILKILKINKKFKLKDRYDRGKSIEMFVIWRDFHHPDGDFETIARNWNGGPRGYLKPKTIKYWMKVKQELYGE
jgi:hypothetical protein